MDSWEYGQDLVKLAELLKPPVHEEEEVEQKSYFTPAGNSKVNNLKDVKINQKKEPSTVEEYEEQQEKEFEKAILDCRKEAIYDIRYRQAVTPEDVYLQMGGKTPSTASCEDMVVTVQLPGEKFSNLELNVLTDEIKLTGFIFKLDLALPSPINPDMSKANWDPISESLILTLRMDREFDFVNF